MLLLWIMLMNTLIYAPARITTYTNIQLIAMLLRWRVAGAHAFVVEVEVVVMVVRIRLVAVAPFER